MAIYRADLHVHSVASPDGRSDLHAIAEAAVRRGLHAVAVADHDLCTPAPAAMNGVLFIPACEVSTKAGHILGLFLARPLDLASLGKLPEPEDAVGAIRRCGGLAVIAHPFQKPDAQAAKFAFDADAVETQNARACFKVPDANEKAAALAKAKSLPHTGGSDAHDAKEVGNAYTELTCDALTLSALRAALLAGESRAVLEKNTPRLRKGLSQWTKARRQGGIHRLARAAAYVCYCGALDLFKRN